MLKAVEKYVKAGFAVHLLRKKSKAPLLESWSTATVWSFDKLQRNYIDGMNLGVRLGKWSKIHGYYLHVIDLDIRNDAEADEAAETIIDLFPEIKTYPRVQSGSMGKSRHFYFVSDKPFGSKKLAHSKGKMQTPDGKWHWDWEIELFGTGKQVVIPPSIHPDTGKAYRWEKHFDFDDLIFDDGPIVDSETLEALVGSGADDTDPDDERIKPLGMSLDEIKDVISRLPKEDWIEDRQGWLNIGMAVHHETGGSDEGFEIWCDSSKISKKYDKKDQKRVWRSFKNRGRPFRMASLNSVVREIELEEEIDNLGDEEGDDFDKPTQKKAAVDDLVGDIDDEDALEFENLGPEPKDDDEQFDNTERARKLKKAKVEDELSKDVPPKIKRLNKKHALAFVKGRTIVVTEKQNGDVDFGSLSQLHDWYENDRVATEKSTEPVSKYWMRHKKRRQYPEGIGFYPNAETPGMYNLWKGWSVESDNSKSCDLLIWHIKNVVCSGNERLFNYMLGWLAHMIQRPEEKPGVAVVLRGKKGAGKDTVADYVGRMFRAHYMMINQQRHLTGNFNAHQERLLMLHVEEGFWAGNKADEGPLKSLITSEFATIERKGIDAFQVNSVLRIFMSSNERWVVPASSDERRYFVLDIDDAYTMHGRRKKDRFEYFKALKRERDNGGAAALLAYLENYDLSGFDVRDVPETAALADQKLAGLRGPFRWWSEQLFSGELEFENYHPSGPMKGEGDWRNGWISAKTIDIYDSYREWHRQHRFQGEIASNNVVIRSIAEMVPEIKKVQFREEDKARVYFNKIPSLDECRAKFSEFMNAEFAWTSDGIEELPPELIEDYDDFDNLDEMGDDDEV